MDEDKVIASDNAEKELAKGFSKKALAEYAQALDELYVFWQSDGKKRLQKGLLYGLTMMTEASYFPCLVNAKDLIEPDKITDTLQDRLNLRERRLLAVIGPDGQYRYITNGGRVKGPLADIDEENEEPSEYQE